MFFDFIFALLDKDTKTLEGMCEDTFMAKLKKNMHNWDQYNLKFDREGTMKVQDFSPGGDLGKIYQSFLNENYLVDFMFVGGVDMDRSKNESN